MARVIVSCDSTPLGAAAIQAAAALAQRLNAELRGVFVEDINLLRTAQLPLVRELVSWSGAVRPLQSTAVDSLLEWQARAMRDALAKAAQAMRLPWSFETVRGAQPVSVIDLMRELDLAVFGHIGRFAAALEPRAKGAVRHAASPVMVFYDGTAASDRALAAAQALITPHDRLLMLTAAGDDVVTASARRWRAGHSLKADVVTLREVKADAIRRVAERYHASALIWSRMATSEDRATLAALVDVLPCPVVVVT